MICTGLDVHISRPETAQEHPGAEISQFTTCVVSSPAPHHLALWSLDIFVEFLMASHIHFLLRFVVNVTLGKTRMIWECSYESYFPSTVHCKMHWNDSWPFQFCITFHCLVYKTCYYFFNSWLGDFHPSSAHLGRLVWILRCFYPDL